jgi:AraC-like DNA-binding protein
VDSFLGYRLSVPAGTRAVLDFLAELSVGTRTLRGVLTVVPVARGPSFAISTVVCRDDHRRWSRPEMRDGYNVVLARRGRFQRRAEGASADIDPTLAYLGVPGTEEQFAHPAGGDVCTWINLPSMAWATLTGHDRRPARSTFYVDGRLDLTHRRMLAATCDVDYAMTQHLLDLLCGVVAQIGTGPVVDRQADRAAVAAAREAILADHPAARGLLPLAALLDISPYRLSRAFTREMGVSLTRYRNRVRLAWALDRLERGETNLASLAADLGYADQAHLSRTARQHLGFTPAALRAIIRS